MLTSYLREPSQLSDLSIVGTCDILVYQCVTKSCDLPDCLIQSCYQYASSNVTERLLRPGDVQNVFKNV